MIDDFHTLEPYSLSGASKAELYLKEQKELTLYHYEHCRKYQNILHAMGIDAEKISSIKHLCDIPFLPVRVFKESDLKSISDEDVFKVMQSSGTTGQQQSKIYLNKETAMLQQKVLLRLLGDFIGKKRLPMLVIDTKKIIKDRKLFTARGATIMGLDFAARKMIFALDEDMNLDIKIVKDFMEQYGNEPFLIFGMTFMIWQYLYKEVEHFDYHPNMEHGYLLTGGGWKKLQAEAVTSETFKQRGQKCCGLKHFIDHYSMSEQSGCIYAECEYGHLHSSIYSEMIPRRLSDFSPCEIGEKGMIQVMSVLPRSYPGHSLLTEDEGMILGEDDCPCGRKGKYIQVFGRIKNAEIRGCSDTYAAGV